MGGRDPLGLGGELVAIRGLQQESSAPSSMANTQQESSAIQPTILLTHKQANKQKYKKNHNILEKETPNQKTNTNSLEQKQ